MSKLKNDLFIRACRRETTERTPIWIMRQAGRYLPEYRAVRNRYDFLTMCKTPELAAEVTLQPIDILDVDAAIIFSDILVIPEAMGLELQMTEGLGPVFPNPITTESDFERLKPVNPAEDLSYVLEAIRITKKELSDRVPLIGFCGSPFTILTYMVEGKGSKNFAKVKSLLYNHPLFAHKLLQEIAEVSAKYLSEQIKSGADAIQIFDTWGGILSKDMFTEFSHRYIVNLFHKLERNNKPVILFAKGVYHSIKELSESSADVLGIDWTTEMSTAIELTKGRVALQGNLDPTVLYAEKSIIKREVIRVLNETKNFNGHIFNLGHGILPDINPDKVKFLVETVKEESLKNKS